MKSIVNVEKFSYSYRGYNRLTNKFSDDYKSINDLLHSEFFKECHTKKGSFLWNKISISLKLKKLIPLYSESKYLPLKDLWNKNYHVRRENSSDIFSIIEVESNRILKIDELQNNANFYYKKYYFRYDDKKYDTIRKNLNINKINVRKIKRKYSSKLKYWNHSFDFSYEIGSEFSYYSKIRTLSETRNNYGIFDDYKNEFPNLVRPKRKNLPSAWDDKPNGIFSLYKSWKHNSKRRKQWVAK